MNKDNPLAKEKVFSRIKISTNEDSCHVWFGPQNKYGYGKLFFNGKQWLAHRLVFFLNTGVVPPVVMHVCDNPSCCNIKHLKGGTQQDNVADMKAKGRASRATRAFGENHVSSVLTDKDVIKMRFLYEQNDMAMAEISRQYGLHENSASKIIRGGSWKHLPVIRKRKNRIRKFGTKLNPSIVLKIREEKRVEGVPSKVLAKRHGVCVSSINQIIRRAIWKHI